MIQPSPARVAMPNERARLIASRYINWFSLSIRDLFVSTASVITAAATHLCHPAFKAVNNKSLRGVAGVVEGVAGHQRDRGDPPVEPVRLHRPALRCESGPPHKSS